MPDESSAVAAAALAQPEVHISAQESPERAGADFSESFAELERAMGEEAPKEVPKADPKPKSAPAKVADKSSAPKSQEADTKSKDTSAESAKSGDGGENGKPLPAPELRKAYQDLKAKYEARGRELEEAKKAPRDDPERKTLSEKLAAAEKHRQQLDEELRHAAYERSQEFKEKYHTPFVEAYKLGQELAQQFKVTDAEGNSRQGTAEDFDALMQIPDADSAAKWAEEVYGTTRAAALMNHRMEVIKLARTRNTALQEAQKMSAEREKSRQEADLNQRKALATKWETVNKEAADKYPDWFAPKEGDDRGNKLLEDGYKWADLAFNGKNMSPEEALELHSWMRNRAAAWGREVYRNKQLTKELTELKAKLKEYEDSEPGPGDGKHDKAEPGELNWEAQLEANWR